ncbi:MAG: hypothetical protein AABX24_00185 [Nanoarchaeota archaeon]
MSDYKSNTNYESNSQPMYSSGCGYTKRKKIGCTCSGQGCRNTCRM